MITNNSLTLFKTQIKIMHVILVIKSVFKAVYYMKLRSSPSDNDWCTFDIGFFKDPVALSFSFCNHTLQS